MTRRIATFRNAPRLALLTLATVILTTRPAPAANTSSGVNLYTIPQELALGRQLAAELEHQSRIVADPVVTDYINRLGQNLAVQASAPFPLTVKMLQSDEMNAFTLPGGHIYVSSAMMKMADNEAELASVISHEIGHAAARHATRQASKSKLARLGALPLGILTGWAGLAANQAASAAAPVAALGFSRAFETEADLLGVGYLNAAGYDPNASIDMFERIASMEKKTPGTVARLFLSHPPTGDRIAKTQAAIRKLKKNNEGDDYVLNTTEFEAVRSRLMAGAE